MRTKILGSGFNQGGEKRGVINDSHGFVDAI